MGDTFVLVMDAPTRTHRILEKGDVLLDADGDPAIALTHVLSTGDDAETQNIRNVGQLTFDAGDTIQLAASGTKLAVTAPGGLVAPVIDVPTSCAIKIATSTKFSVSASSAYTTVAMLLSDGTAAAPGLAFTGNANTGIYRVSSSTLGLSASGGLRLSLSATAITATVQLLMATGTAGAPSLAFTGAVDKGLYNASSNVVGVAAGGARVASFGVNGVELIDGSEASPSCSFSNDEDTGIYRPTLNTVGVTGGGTLRLSVSGAGVIAAVKYVGIDGTAGAPSYVFTSDNTTGIHGGAASLALSVSGTDRMALSATAIDITVPITQTGSLVLDGTAAVYLKTNSTQVLACTTALVAVTNVPFRVTEGAVGAPSIYFDGSATTGFYRSAADEIGVAIGGVLGMKLNAGGLAITSGGLQTPITTASSTPVTVTAAMQTVLVNAGTGAIVVDLPAASAVAGRTYCFKKIDASANAVTLTPNGTDSIESAVASTTYALSAQWDGVILQASGSVWYVLATV